MEGCWLQRQQAQVVRAQTLELPPYRFGARLVELPGSPLDAERTGELGNAPDARHQIVRLSGIPLRNTVAGRFSGAQRDEHAGIDVTQGHQ